MDGDTTETPKSDTTWLDGDTAETPGSARTWLDGDMAETLRFATTAEAALLLRLWTTTQRSETLVSVGAQRRCRRKKRVLMGRVTTLEPPRRRHPILPEPPCRLHRMKRVTG